MRKRQVKKFAKNARKSMKPYRDAAHRGSKKLTRRHRAFGRYWSNGLAFWDQSRVEWLRLSAWGRAAREVRGLDDIVRVYMGLSAFLSGAP